MALSCWHGTTVGVGERDLSLARLVHLLAQGSQLPLSLPQNLDLLLEFFGSGFAKLGFLLVVRLQLPQVLLDLGFNLLRQAFQFPSGEVAVSSIDRLELGSIDGNKLPPPNRPNSRQ